MKVRNEYLTGYDDERFGFAAEAVSRRRLEAVLARLKRRLLNQFLENYDISTHEMLRRAADDAAALAWTTPSAVLFFPGLLEEKVSEGMLYLDRQRNIRERFGGSCQSAA